MYILHVLSGEERETGRKLTEKGYHILLPEAVKQERRGGKWMDVLRVMMPGYLFVETDMSPETYYDIVEAGEIIRMLNYSDPMPEDEVEMIHKLAGAVTKPVELVPIEGGGWIVDNEDSAFYGCRPKCALLRQRRAIFGITVAREKYDISVTARAKTMDR